MCLCTAPGRLDPRCAGFSAVRETCQELQRDVRHSTAAHPVAHSPPLQAVLSSGRGPLSAPNPMCTVPSCTVLQQPVVATIRVEGGAGQAQQELQVGGC